MPDMGMIGGVAVSLSHLANITKAMIGLRDQALIQEKVIELQGAILDAQSGVFAANDERASLIEQVTKLESEIANLKAWETEKQRYHLKKVSELNSTAYVLKPEAQGAEPPHCICPACYEHGKKGILQPVVGAQAYRRPWQCPQCKTEMLVQMPLPGYEPPKTA
jgi:hypothetical protein